MAAPIELDLAGFAGISTHIQDLRVQNAGKRVTGMLGITPGKNPPLGFAGIPTKQGEISFDVVRTRGEGHSHRDSMDCDFTESLRSIKPIRPAKPSRKHYATDADYRLAFDTRWRADHKGRMALYLSRKAGHASMETNPDKLDMIHTFHRERGSAGIAYKPDNLCNELFLTGSKDAQTMDVLKPQGNRAPPCDNPDGPFSQSLIGLHPSKIDHLDRTCNPRIEAPRTPIDYPNDGTGKGRMRVFREQSHIYPQGGLLIGDNRPPWYVARQTIEDEAERRLGLLVQRRALVNAPWTQDSFLGV